MLARKIKAGLTLARDVRTAWKFLEPEGRSSCRGVYDTFESAMAACPKHLRTGFNHDEMVNMYREDYMEWNPNDYPVIFWLGRILAPGLRVLDLGGSVGMCYYAYQKFLPFPKSVYWTVCDVPSAVETGMKIARDRRSNNLRFVSDIEEADPCDVLLTCGALPYISRPLDDILAAIGTPPRHLLINRIPLSNEPTFYTVQNQGFSFAPYRIQNQPELFVSIERAGYRQLDNWHLPRTCRVPFHSGKEGVQYQGCCYTLDTEMQAATSRTDCYG